MNIGIDMMGGDFAPLEAVKGIHLYLKANAAPVNIYCIGDEIVIRPLLEEYGISSPHLHFVHASETIGYHDHPTKAFKEKQQSSIVIGFKLLATGQIDAFISAGNTGAMLVGAMFTIKVLPGVLRPVVSGVLPKINGGDGVLLDAGLNADCKPEHLNQFAILGSLYSHYIFNVATPTVGLINIGEEEGKGNILSQATYPLLKENTSINFIGNLEGRDFFSDKADVMVCDGFTGNIVLKLAETFYDLAELKGIHKDSYMQRFHYENYGGSPVIGVAKPVVIGHGISTAKAFNNMFGLAIKMVETDLCGKIKERFSSIAESQA
ncbi:phosphate acyltransferase PlsX [Parasediminibacterium sp. JCM 36343]|uniref:phosphate acyltransferase PlsX n=1 Tax=Parasediminibacterium sp. JCM 36343 TaxID=3374279 RepID=UPI003979F6EB